MSDPTFGIAITRVDNEIRPATTSDMAVIGLVGTAPGADSATYPQDEPVLIFSDDTVAVAALGLTGTLVSQIDLINQQLGDFEVAAKIVIVRVADGGSDTATLTNLVGNSTLKTGIHALRKAGPKLGVVPRLLGVPGFTHQQVTGVASVGMTVPGTGYTSAPTVAFSGGGGTGAAGTAILTNGLALTVGTGGTGYTTAPTLSIPAPPQGGVQAVAVATVAAGVITGVNVTEPGKGYLVAPTITVVPTNGGTGGVINAALTGRVGSVLMTNSGSGYTSAPSAAFTGGGGAAAAGTPVIDLVANVVCAALPAVCSALLAHAVVTGPHTSLLDFTNWRETISSSRLIPVETWVKVGVSATVTDSVGAVLGVAVRRDHEKNGRPFHSWANQPLYGVVAPNRDIEFSLTEGSTEAQSILALNGGVILRGEAGVESAIASGGFIFVGTDNGGDDALWQFYNVTRGRDYIHLLFLRTLRGYLGKFNLTGQTIQAVLNTMNSALRDLQADGDILGYKVGFTRSQNSPENLRLGKFNIDFQAEEAPVLRYLGIRSARYRPALDTLLDNLLAQLDVAA